MVQAANQIDEAGAKSSSAITNEASQAAQSINEGMVKKAR